MLHLTQHGPAMALPQHLGVCAAGVRMCVDARARAVIVHVCVGLTRVSSSTHTASLSALHVCCSFMYGQESWLALAVWEVWHKHMAKQALAELQRCALVSVDADGCLKAHDVIRALGTGLLRDKEGSDHYATRLWAEDGHMVHEVRELLPCWVCIWSMPVSAFTPDRPPAVLA